MGVEKGIGRRDLALALSCRIFKIDIFINFLIENGFILVSSWLEKWNFSTIDTPLETFLFAIPLKNLLFHH